MESFDYTVPSELMIENYNSRVNKLSSGKVNIIRSWPNIDGIGTKQVPFTMANRTKKLLPIKRYNLSSLVPLNEDGFLIVNIADFNAAASAAPGGLVGLKESLANASNIPLNNWGFYNTVEILWTLYGVYLPPQDYYETNMFSDSNTEWFAQFEDSEFAPQSLIKVTARDNSLGFAGELKLIIMSTNPKQQPAVRNLDYIHNNSTQDAWEITHPDAAGGMAPIIDDILTTITEIDTYDMLGQGKVTLDTLSLSTEFIDSETGGIITVTSNDDRAIGSFDIVVSAPDEYTMDLGQITNDSNPGHLALNTTDIDLRASSLRDHGPRYEYVTQQYIINNYPEYSDRNYFLKTVSITKIDDKTVDFVFVPTGRSSMGELNVTVTWNTTLHLSELSNVDQPGVWEITDPNSVIAGSWSPPMDMLASHMATKIRDVIGGSSISASAFKVIPQPNSTTPEGTASAILKPAGTNNQGFIYFIDGELLVKYPDIGYVHVDPVDLSKLSNHGVPGAWEVEATSLEDFRTKFESQKVEIITQILKGTGVTPNTRNLNIGTTLTGYTYSGGWSEPNLKNSISIYPYIK